MYSEAPRTVWFALLGPPTAWFIALNAAYFMTDWACGSGAGTAALHGTVLAMLATSVAAGMAGLRLWRGAGERWPGESSAPVTRTRFLAVLGTFAGGLFSLTILWFWLAALVLDPCEPGPRLRFSPSAVARPWMGGLA